MENNSPEKKGIEEKENLCYERKKYVKVIKMSLKGSIETDALIFNNKKFINVIH